MRLIHCASLTLRLFNDEQQLPEYAILSHRWVEGQEVLFKDLVKSRNLNLGGWQKIRFCCSQALKDGIEYCWVDTCCIDKTSSAELSEAINSMYRYYSGSKVCYSYLFDVNKSNGAAVEIQLVQSSWFTRCWTLQELIAPRVVDFYDKAWRKLGSRSDLCEELAEASGIHLSVFTSHFEPEEWSIAQRMSWASNRTATRVEDVAYSLLGLFDVNIPLLYGEGAKAFLRLQEEIIRRTSDHTIFAWSKLERLKQLRSYYTWIHTGLLATSPSAFKDDGNLVAKNFDNPRAYAINNLGLEISLPVISWAPNLLLVGLNCTRNSQDRVYIFVMDKADVAHFSVRVVRSGSTHIEQRCHLSSSIYRTLTIATQLGPHLQTRLDSMDLYIYPYLDWWQTKLRPLSPLSNQRWHPPQGTASRFFIRHRPSYGFHCILEVPDRESHADRAESKYMSFMKIGHDLLLHPFCIISDRTYASSTMPVWFQDVDLSYEKNKDTSTKSFWECTGLEEAGWILPDTLLSGTSSPRNKHGVWALKGHLDKDCKFTLTGDQAGEYWKVRFQRRWNGDKGWYFDISTSCSASRLSNNLRDMS